MGVNKIIDLSKERALRSLEYLDEYCFLYVEEFCFLLNWDINDFPILLKTLGVQASGMQSTDFECKFDLISEKSEKICGLYLTFNEDEDYGIIEITTSKTCKRYEINTPTDIRLVRKLTAKSENIIVSQIFQKGFYTSMMKVEDHILQIEFVFGTEFDLSPILSHNEDLEKYLFSLEDNFDELSNINKLFEVNSEFFGICNINEKELVSSLILYGGADFLFDPEIAPICHIAKEYGVLTEVSEDFGDYYIAIYKDGSWQYVSSTSSLIYDKISKAYEQSFSEDTTELFIDIPKINEKVNKMIEEFF